MRHVRFQANLADVLRGQRAAARRLVDFGHFFDPRAGVAVGGFERVEFVYVRARDDFRRVAEVVENYDVVVDAEERVVELALALGVWELFEKPHALVAEVADRPAEKARKGVEPCGLARGKIVAKRRERRKPLFGSRFNLASVGERKHRIPSDKRKRRAGREAYERITPPVIDVFRALEKKAVFESVELGENRNGRFQVGEQFGVDGDYVRVRSVLFELFECWCHFVWRKKKRPRQKAAKSLNRFKLYATFGLDHQFFINLNFRVSIFFSAKTMSSNFFRFFEAAKSKRETRNFQCGFF